MHLRLTHFLVLTLALALHSASAVHNIYDYGAVGDTETIEASLANTKAITLVRAYPLDPVVVVQYELVITIF